MIVGFTITDFKGHEKDAAEYIRKVCILESPDIADNIVEAGPGVNVFSRVVTQDELDAQPFSAVPIETKDGKYIIASKVNFNLELLYNENILRLVPTEYIYVEPNEVSQFETYIIQNLVRIIPDWNGSASNNLWILAEGWWNDEGIWIDEEFWRDS